jgi:hypothetical protein
MKKFFILIYCFQLSLLIVQDANAQCAVCSKTVAQMGEKPAKALNGAIIYLMLTPFAIAGVVGVRWWKSNKQ